MYRKLAGDAHMDFPEPITTVFMLNAKLYVVTPSQTYRVRERKRRRDKNKVRGGFVRSLASSEITSPYAS